MLLLTVVESVKNGTLFNWGACGVLVSFLSFCRYEGMEFILIVPFVMVGMAVIDKIKRKSVFLNIASFSICFGIASLFLLSLSGFETGILSKLEDIGLLSKLQKVLGIHLTDGAGTVRTEKIVETVANDAEKRSLIDSLVKTIKGVNIFIFIWMIPGVYLVLRERKGKDNRKLYLYFAATGFMIAWRVAIRIITSRYSVALIIPFAFFAAVFLVNTFRKRHIPVMLAVCAFTICTFALYVKMDFDSMTRYHYSTIVSDAFKKYDETQKRNYVVRRVEYTRLTFMCDTKNVVRPIKDSETFYGFFKKQGGIRPRTVVCYQIKKDNDTLRGFRNVKKLVSIPQNEKGTKKQIISSVSSEQGELPVFGDGR